MANDASAGSQGAPRRRWIMRATSPAGQDTALVVQVDAATGDVNVQVGHEVAHMQPSAVSRLRHVLGLAQAQGLSDRGQW